MRINESNFPNSSVELNKLAALEIRHWKEFTRVIREYILQSNSQALQVHLEEIEASLEIATN